MHRNAPLSKWFLAMVISVAMLAGTAYAASRNPGSKYGVVFRFPNAGHGYDPYELIADSAGNLYGATQYGGVSCCGIVFKLTPPQQGGKWTETILKSFKSGRFGAGISSLLLDNSGNLYGVASEAGTHGFGYVFKLTPPAKGGENWTETRPYTFQGWDGYQPEGLAIDQSGNLYGATYGGGRGCEGGGCGTVYKLTPPEQGKIWKRTVLYFFKGVLGNGSGDGANPFDVIFDGKGNLYGVTGGGGICQQGICYGTIFELTPPQHGTMWKESILYRFEPNYGLVSGVVFDKSGALYGATLTSVYQLAQKNGVWTYTDLQDFNGGANGYYLLGGVIPDQTGNVYGTTAGGGTGDGIVFQLSPPGESGDWTETVLHDFSGSPDGNEPTGDLAFGKDGFLYGTTLSGGITQKCGMYQLEGCGAVFRIAP